MKWTEQDIASSHWVTSTQLDGLKLHLRARGDDPIRSPVLFVHGATLGSRLYDVPHPGASWIAATADAGFAAYALDIRGYGKSRHVALETGRIPLVRAQDAIRDIDDSVNWICQRHGTERVQLVGGSWGSITTGLFASTIGAEKVSGLILYAPIYAAPNREWLTMLSDSACPEKLSSKFEAIRSITEEEIRTRWDKEIPAGATWRNEETFQALMQSSFSDDPEACRSDPPAFRAPNGTLADLWEAFNGRPLYDPNAIKIPVLLIRGGSDPTSTRQDALDLFDNIGSEQRDYIEIANGTHFVIAEKRANDVFAVATTFLSGI